MIPIILLFSFEVASNLGGCPPEKNSFANDFYLLYVYDSFRPFFQENEEESIDEVKAKQVLKYIQLL